MPSGGEAYVVSNASSHAGQASQDFLLYLESCTSIARQALNEVCRCILVMF